MPEGSENTEGKTQEQDQQLPEKYRGKTAAEIAAMHEELEQLLGRQSTEIGQLRQTVADLSAAHAASTREREPADKSEYARSKYAKYAEDLIVNPEEALPKLVEELRSDLRSDLVRETSTQFSYNQQVENFFRANPELDQYREIVSVIGERIFRMNPNAPLSQILEATKREALAYLGSLKERMSGRGKSDADKRRNAITTSGGRAREGAETPESERGERETELDADQANVLKAVQEIREFRSKRIAPPRAAR